MWTPMRQELMDPAKQGDLPLNAREKVANDPAKEVLPFDTHRESKFRAHKRGYIKAKSVARQKFSKVPFIYALCIQYTRR